MLESVQLAGKFQVLFGIMFRPCHAAVLNTFTFSWTLEGPGFSPWLLGRLSRASLCGVFAGASVLMPGQSVVISVSWPAFRTRSHACTSPASARRGPGKPTATPDGRAGFGDGSVESREDRLSRGLPPLPHFCCPTRPHRCPRAAFWRSFDQSTAISALNRQPGLILRSTIAAFALLCGCPRP